MEFRRFKRMIAREMVIVHQVLWLQHIRLHISKSPEQSSKRDIQFTIRKSESNISAFLSRQNTKGCHGLTAFPHILLCLSQTERMPSQSVGLLGGQAIDLGQMFEAPGSIRDPDVGPRSSLRQYTISAFVNAAVHC